MYIRARTPVVFAVVAVMRAMSLGKGRHMRVRGPAIARLAPAPQAMAGPGAFPPPRKPIVLVAVYIREKPRAVEKRKEKETH